MKVTQIVAIDLGFGIGKDGRVPWRLPADLARFRRLTMAKPVLMGRRTYESIGRPLDGRTNIVVSRALRYIECCTVVDSIDAGLSAASDSDEILVIGGSEIYADTAARCARIHLSIVDGRFDVDTLFYALDPREWEIAERQECAADARSPLAHTYLRLERRLTPREGPGAAMLDAAALLRALA